MDESLLPSIVETITAWINQGADALGITAGQIAESLISWIVSGLASAFELAFAPLFELISTPVSFDFAKEVTLGFQGAAIIVILLVILGRGVSKGIIGSATDDDMDVVRYIWKSLVPIGVVILTPTIAAIVISAASLLMGYICGQASVDAFAHNMGVLVVNIVGIGAETVNAVSGISGLSASLILSLVIAIAIFWNVFALTLEILKRWIQLALMSIVLPFTAIPSAFEDTNDIISAIKTMVGIVITIMLQILLLISASGLLASQVSIGVVQTAFLFIAVLAAARALPSWIEKFTYASSLGSSGGSASRIALAAMRFIPRKG